MHRLSSSARADGCGFTRVRAGACGLVLASVLVACGPQDAPSTADATHDPAAAWQALRTQQAQRAGLAAEAWALLQAASASAAAASSPTTCADVGPARAALSAAPWPERPVEAARWQDFWQRRAALDAALRACLAGPSPGVADVLAWQALQVRWARSESNWAAALSGYEARRTALGTGTAAWPALPEDAVERARADAENGARVDAALAGASSTSASATVVIAPGPGPSSHPAR